MNAQELGQLARDMDKPLPEGFEQAVLGRVRQHEKITDREKELNDLVKGDDEPEFDK